MSFRNNSTVESTRRQGDLLFIKRTSIPQDRPFVAQKDGVILEGEVTGHKHELTSTSRAHGSLQMLVMPDMVEKVSLDEVIMEKPPRMGKNVLQELAVANESLLREEGVMAYVVVNAGQQVVIQHPDHKDIHLGEGFWEVRRQREFVGQNAAGRLVED